MIKRFPVLVALLALLAPSCANALEPWSSDAPANDRNSSTWCVPKLGIGKGRISIYRTAPKGLGVPPEIVVDGRRFEALLPGTGFRLEVAPGAHLVMLAYDKDKLEVAVDSGQDVFVRFDLDPALFGREFFAVLVAPETAQVELYKHAGVDFGCTKE